MRKPKFITKPAIYLLVVVLSQSFFLQGQGNLVDVNWTWFYETSTLLFSGFTEIEQEVAQNAIKNHTADIAEIDRRLSDINLLLTSLSETQTFYMQAFQVAPADLVYLQLSAQSLHTGLSALRESLDKIGNKLTASDQRALILLAKNSYIAHQLALTVFSQQPIESIRR
jgi:hypothetical protein